MVRPIIKGTSSHASSISSRCKGQSLFCRRSPGCEVVRAGPIVVFRGFRASVGAGRAQVCRLGEFQPSRGCRRPQLVSEGLRWGRRWPLPARRSAASTAPRRSPRSPDRSQLLVVRERLPTSGWGLSARAHPPPSGLLSPGARVVDVEHREREVSRAVVVETEQYDVRQRTPCPSVAPARLPRTEPHSASADELFCARASGAHCRGAADDVGYADKHQVDHRD
eukprot:COSAG02_NODE_7712_length_2878_cov_26.479309_1_plen_223_part_00